MKFDDPLGLFGDGAPTWTINKGKVGDRESPSADEAMRQQETTTAKLRWHGNHAANTAGHPTRTSLAALALADKLEACAPPRNPCLSGACPICIRAHAVVTAYLATFNPGHLHQAEIGQFHDQLRQRFNRAAFRGAILVGGTEVAGKDDLIAHRAHLAHVNFDMGDPLGIVRKSGGLRSVARDNRRFRIPQGSVTTPTPNFREFSQPPRISRADSLRHHPRVIHRPFRPPPGRTWASR
jgi:hypothetical protein